MKKVFLGLLIGVLISATAIIYAETESFTALKATFKIFVNGQELNSDKPALIVNGNTYLPLRVMGEALGTNVSWNATKRQAEIGEMPNPETNLPAILTIDNITVKIAKVEQDSELLKIFVTYTNNTNTEVSTAESLAKIVCNNTQYEYDMKLDIDNLKSGYDKAPYGLEPKVTANSVLFFKHIPDAERINISLGTNYNKFKFNNIKVINK